MLREATSLQTAADPEWSAKLYRQMAVYCTSQRDYKEAINLYKRALQYTPNDSSLQIALVKLYMQVRAIQFAYFINYLYLIPILRTYNQI